MKNLTTIAALPSGPGCASKLPPEVGEIGSLKIWKSPAGLSIRSNNMPPPEFMDQVHRFGKWLDQRAEALNLPKLNISTLRTPEDKKELALVFEHWKKLHEPIDLGPIGGEG